MDKTYYVTGKDFYGVTRTVKIVARTPADARYRAELFGGLEKAGRLIRA